MKELYSATEAGVGYLFQLSGAGSTRADSRDLTWKQVMVRKVVIDEILDYGLESVRKSYEPRSLKGKPGLSRFLRMQRTDS